MVQEDEQLLNDLGVEYYFGDVDLMTGAERNGSDAGCSKAESRLFFPTLIIGDKCIIGFQENKIKEALGK